MSLSTLFRLIADSVSEGLILVCGETLEMVAANRSAETLLGEEPGALDKRRLHEVVPAEALTLPAEGDARFAFTTRAGAELCGTFRWLPDDRGERPAIVRLKRKPEAHVSALNEKIAGLAAEIERRQALEGELRESEQRYRQLAESTQALPWEATAGKERLLYVAPRLAEKFGYPAEAWAEPGFWARHVLAEDRERARIAFLGAGRPDVTVEYRFVRADGSVVWLQDTASLFTDAHGAPAGWRGFSLDITARKTEEEERARLSEQMLHAQKLESLGVLAGGIAHDFNNLLVAIIGNASLALMDLPAESPARPAIKSIETAGQRAAELTRQMLAYSGRGRFFIENINLNTLVQEMSHLLEVSISKKAVLKYHFAANLPVVEADATQVRQIVMNLITNASDAMGEKSGVITLATGVVEADRAYLAQAQAEPNLAEGFYVFVEVSDTGCGMSEQTQQRIFDPFFTTKFTGRGLGLAAVLGIVRSHKGAIRVQSQLGRGTTFKVLFPCRPSAAPALDVRGASASPFPVWQAQGKLLVIDDEETVCTIAKQALQRIGFTVFTAGNGRDGLEIFRQHAAEIRLVILDMTMPVLSGEETYRELRRLREEVRIVLSSGYNEQESTGRFSGRNLTGFLQKPYKVNELVRVVRQSLEGKP